MKVASLLMIGQAAAAAHLEAKDASDYATQVCSSCEECYPSCGDGQMVDNLWISQGFCVDLCKVVTTTAAPSTSTTTTTTTAKTTASTTTTGSTTSTPTITTRAPTTTTTTSTTTTSMTTTSMTTSNSTAPTTTSTATPATTPTGNSTSEVCLTRVTPNPGDVYVDFCKACTDCFPTCTKNDFKSELTWMCTSSGCNAGCDQWCYMQPPCTNATYTTTTTSTYTGSTTTAPPPTYDCSSPDVVAYKAQQDDMQTTTGGVQWRTDLVTKTFKGSTYKVPATPAKCYGQYKQLGTDKEKAWATGQCKLFDFPYHSGDALSIAPLPTLSVDPNMGSNDYHIHLKAMQCSFLPTGSSSSVCGAKGTQWYKHGQNTLSAREMAEVWNAATEGLLWPGNQPSRNGGQASCVAAVSTALGECGHPDVGIVDVTHIDGPACSQQTSGPDGIWQVASRTEADQIFSGCTGDDTADPCCNARRVYAHSVSEGGAMYTPFKSGQTAFDQDYYEMWQDKTFHAPQAFVQRNRTHPQWNDPVLETIKTGQPIPDCSMTANPWVDLMKKVNSSYELPEGIRVTAGQEPCYWGPFSIAGGGNGLPFFQGYFGWGGFFEHYTLSKNGDMDVSPQGNVFPDDPKFADPTLPNYYELAKWACGNVTNQARAAPAPTHV